MYECLHIVNVTQIQIQKRKRIVSLYLDLDLDLATNLICDLCHVLNIDV